MASGELPDIILLDVEMPGMNGYEVCDTLKQQSETKDIPIVFLSGNGSLQQRMQGYEMGGADYIVKPFESEDLIAKSKVLIDYTRTQRDLTGRVEDASKTAHMALTTSSELGSVIKFVEHCFQIRDVRELGADVLGLAQQMQLNTIIRITVDDEILWLSDRGEPSPLEQEVMTMLEHAERINDFGSRTVINYPRISMMIKNMPLDNMERYGQIKDLVPAILTTANGKLDTMHNDAMIQRQTRELVEVTKSIPMRLGVLFEQSDEVRKRSVDVLEKMFNDLDLKIPHMGLEEDQEAYILHIIDASVQDATNLIQETEHVFESIIKVLDELEALAEKQQTVSDQIHNNSICAEPTSEAVNISSVELF